MAETPNEPAQGDAEELLAAAETALSDLSDMKAEVANAVTKPAAGHAAPQSVQFPTFDGALNPAQAHAMDLLGDVHLNVKIELGRTRMLVEDVLRLAEGAVVELDKLAGDPVDVYVNDRHVAKGEVLVLNDNFCVRINEVLSPAAEAADKGAA